LPARILIVEDDYLVAMQMEAALTEAGFEIPGIASSAEEALELAAVRRPAMVVMDVRLGGRRDGIDAALELFGRHGIRCIFATAHYDAKVRARAQPAAPLAWVPKPYAMPALVGAVQRALRELEKES
jgi:DNA-binding NarL/FixJ family response regulator